MTSSPANSLVIFLHGVGSRGADLMPLAQSWQHVLPADFAAPDGPSAFDGGGQGRQWFSIAGVTEANRPQRIVAARPAFDEVLGNIIDQHGLSQRLDRVALVGFSQGSIMALDAVASGRWPVAAVVAYSGRLASPRPLAPAGSTSALLVHGAADTVIPAASSTEAAATLREHGLEAQSVILPGVGHTITAQGAQLGADFIAKRLAAHSSPT
ncbi:alpha/beta hydrolase [Aminobacter sp. Piv2-1]|uniref:alpha/beta hydrolase n=1 Tax=Aminobacter sp. Piv2-1 TaxID=3031122 RepID=UPI0030A50CC8